MTPPDLMREITTWLSTELFVIGQASITPLSIVLFVLTLLGGVIGGRLARRAIERSFRGRGDPGASYAIGRMVQIALVITGALLAVENVGIDLTTLAALGAMLSVGIGLGLQSIAQNFAAGITILIQQPIKKGDFVVVGDVVGVVDEIAMRTTRILTRDHIAILVPNSELTASQVTNISKPDDVYRARIAVGVSYGSDCELVRRVLLEVARGHDEVLTDPEPIVMFQSFGDSSLDFELGVWLAGAEREPIILSDLRFAIVEAFREHDVEIPFPQRDLHVRSGLEPLGRAA